MTCVFAVGLVFLFAGSLPAQTAKWKFLVLGDTRGDGGPINTNILAELVSAITHEKPEFILVAGDLVHWGSLESFQAWTNALAPAYQAGIGVFPVTGNHDLGDVASFRRVFGPQIPDNGPGGELDRTYFLVHSNALILALDNYAGTSPINQAWVDAVLATNAQLHVFALGHEPAFKALHADCLDADPAGRDVFWRSLRNVQAHAYFCGHDHFLNHARIEDGDGDPSNDVHQYISGGGGGPLYDGFAYDGANGGWTPVEVMHASTNGYLRVSIETNTVTMTLVHRTTPGTYLDTTDVFSRTLRPRLNASCDSGALTLTWRGGGVLQAAAEPGGPFTNVLGATSPMLVQKPAEESKFFRVNLP